MQEVWRDLFQFTRARRSKTGVVLRFSMSLQLCLAFPVEETSSWVKPNFLPIKPLASSTGLRSSFVGSQ